MGLISCFKTIRVIAVASNVIINEKNKIDAGEIVCSKKRTKKRIPISGICIPIKATNKNLNA
jgi:hypothetical protein